ncbi:MAG: bifunctional sugar-1-phosphate nucleotidylyltransferase/acetyltransferase [Candidatus Thorarchaeota archaeon]|nr:MAG: glucose-1-phosphate thymidylyltransferase [Candidatus Thorarchaeota archaeon]
MRKAIVLAAGESTRMLPLSANRPKHLLPVAGKPLIFHTIDALSEAGLRDVLFVVGYHAEKLTEAINAYASERMTVSFVTQEERRGTAHAAGYAEEFARGDNALMIYGDIMAGLGTFKGLSEFHEKGEFDLTLSVKPIEDSSAYGVVQVEGRKATDLIEKPRPGQVAGNLVNAGIYAVGDSLWEAIRKTNLSPRGEYEITDSIQMLIREGNVGAYTLPSWWIDVGRPWDLLEANRLLLSDMPGRIEGVVEEGATILNTAVIEEGARVKAGAYVEGPVYISEGDVVGPNCYLRAYTYLGKRVKVGNAVEVKNSIIMEGTNVGHLSYVGDSIIGANSNFGAGTITANLRHDNKSVSVTVKGARVNSGRRKLGAIIGDDVKTGIGTSISPGVVLHQGARTGIGVIVDRDIGPGQLVIAKQEKRIIDRELVE